MSTAPSEDKPNKRLRLDEPTKDETMKTEEVKSEPALDTDIYFEPRWLCDIKVIYQGQVFHCHRYALIKESKVLEATLSGDRECKQLEIPELKTNINPATITVQQFQDFLSFVHSTGKIETDIIPIAYLFHYFETDRIRSTFEKDCLNATEPAWRMINHLTAATEYKWKRRKEFLQRVVDKLSFYMQTFSQSSQNEAIWNQLSMEAQRDVYLMYIKKMLPQTITIPAKLLPSFTS